MFGGQMRAYRLRLGMTQEELAARTGVSVRSIRNLEAGRTGRPRPGTVRLLANAFELAGADRDRFCRSALEDTAQPQTGEASDDAVADPIHGRPVPAQLPADVAGFVGRTEQLRCLSELLDRGDRPAAVVISAIAGTAGVGKTALAVHWARQVARPVPGRPVVHQSSRLRSGRDGGDARRGDAVVPGRAGRAGPAGARGPGRAGRTVSQPAGAAADAGAAGQRPRRRAGPPVAARHARLPGAGHQPQPTHRPDRRSRRVAGAAGPAQPATRRAICSPGGSARTG